MLYQKKKIVDTMASYDVRYETLQKSIKEEKKHAKEIEKEKEYMQSDEYIAQVAREKLGLVKDLKKARSWYGNWIMKYIERLY